MKLENGILVYLSGKMTGITKEDYTQRFSIAAENCIAEILESDEVSDDCFCHVVNPVELGEELEDNMIGEIPTWYDYMVHDLHELLNCDAIYMLKGWEDSKGAKIEHNLAKGLGIKVFYQK